MRSKIKIAFVFAYIFASLHCYCVFTQQPIKNISYFDPSKNFSVSIYSDYVSSAQIQDNIRSLDPILRNASTDIKGAFGYGGELNYTPSFLDHDFTFYISSEYLKIDNSDLILRFFQDTLSGAVHIEEKLKVLPVELGVKWNLPVGTDNFKIYIGGGAGLYFGDRQRIIAGIFNSETVSKSPGFSLNILSGMLLYIEKNLAANFEIKFRDANYEVENKFAINYITINGASFALDNPLYSRISVDGVRVSLGLKYNF